MTLRLLAASLDARPDEDLVAVFVACGDEAAFAAMVRRHGGLVLDVCRSVLRNHADAEDAFQATFLALAAKAQTLRTPASLAGWLHGTACQVARKARRARDRRRNHEARAPIRPAFPPPDPSWAEVREVIHEEVNRLPERYREAIVLFYLVGRSQDEVGRALGLSKDGAKRRLERGRARLRGALGRRGLGPASLLAATAVVLAEPPAVLATAAVRCVIARGEVPATILSLVPNGIRPMSMISWLAPATVLIAATAAGFGMLWASPTDNPPGPDTPSAAKAAVRVGDPDSTRHRFTVLVTKNEPWPRPTRCAFLDNDRILVQAGTPESIEVRDAKTGKTLKRLSVGGQLLGDFRLSPDRKWIAAVTTPDPTGTWLMPRIECDITVWDTATWKVRGTIDSCQLRDLASDGRTVLVNHNGRIEVWDVVERKRLKAAPFEFKRIDAAALSPDGSVAAVSGLNEIAYWKWKDGDKYDRVKVGRKVDALLFSPDGKLVAEGPDTRRTVEVRDVATLKVAQALSDLAQPRVPQTVAGMAFADSGRTLAFGNGVGLIASIPVPHRIHFWDVRSGKLIRQINLKGGAPSSLDVSPDGKALAALTADGGVSLRVFDLGPAD
jgi:RNA polymerase sigma factor (sigma-70 family)